MNNTMSNFPMSRKTFGIRIYLMWQVLSAFILFSSACAQSSADHNQSQGKNLSTLPTVSANQSDDESLIEEIRKSIASKNYRRLAELIKSKPDLNVRNKNNDSLLVEAMQTDIKSFEMLLEAGADPNFSSNTIGCAESERCLKPPTYIAFEGGNMAALKLLLQFRADPNAESILAWAVSRGNREAVELLLFHKADVTFNNAVGENRQPSIFFAVEPKIAELLIKNGADVNQADENGLTPLMVAVEEANLKMVRFLVKNGASVNVQNKKGETILQLAKKIGDKKIITELRKAGAND